MPTTTSTTTIRIMWSIDLYNTIRDAPFFNLLFLIIQFIWNGWTTLSLLVRVRAYYLWAYYVHIWTGLKSNSVLCILYYSKTSSLTEISNIILHPSILSCLVIWKIPYSCCYCFVVCQETLCNWIRSSPSHIVNIIFIQSNLAPNILNQARLLENGSVKNAPLPCFKMIFLIWSAPKSLKNRFVIDATNWFALIVCVRAG